MKKEELEKEIKKIELEIIREHLIQDISECELNEELIQTPDENKLKITYQCELDKESIRKAALHRYLMRTNQ